MKKLILIVTLVISITFSACGKNNSQSVEAAQSEDAVEMVVDGGSVHNDDSMFIRHRLEDGYSILEERGTGVCYLEYYNNRGYASVYGITSMINPDGTAKVWER